MQEQYDLWCNPADVDITYAMEEKLMEVKTVMFEGLEAVMARGENIQVLQEKAAQVQVRANVLKKKAKKMNAPWWQRWFGGLCAGGGGPCGGPE